MLGKKKEDIEQGGAGNAPLTTEWRRGGQPGMVKKRCSRCSYWFAVPVAEVEATSRCPDCASKGSRDQANVA